jgi:hypothetical protein
VGNAEEGEMTSDRFTQEDIDRILKDNPDITVNKGNPMTAISKLSFEKLAELQREVGIIKETEAQFQTWVIDYAKLKGWKVAHFRPAKTDKGWRTAVEGDAGFFDCVFARNGVTIIAELKSESGKLSPEQQEWYDAMQGDGVATTMVFVWKPSDRPDIERILA